MAVQLSGIVYSRVSIASASFWMVVAVQQSNNQIYGHLKHPSSKNYQLIASKLSEELKIEVTANRKNKIKAAIFVSCLQTCMDKLVK